MPPHPLTSFEIQNYYQNEPKFIGVYSRNNLPKMKEGSYVINIDKFKSIGTHWIALYANGNNGSNLTVQYISIALQLNILQKEILKIIGSKNIITKFIE